MDQEEKGVEFFEIRSRIDETLDVSDLGDLGSQGPITEQQAFQKRDALAANIKEEAHRRYSNKKRPCPKPAPHRFRGQPLH